MDIDDFSLEPQKEELLLEIPNTSTSISLIKPEDPSCNAVALTPSAVKYLIEQNIRVFVQYGFSANSPYSDSDYADAGAEFVDKFPDLAILGKIIIKFDSFTEEQLIVVPQEKIIFSTKLPNNLSIEYIKILNSKRIVSFAGVLLKDAIGESLVDKIISESLSDLGFNVALSSLLLPIVETLVHSPNIPYALQKNMHLIQGIYTYKAWLCSQIIAEKLNLQWRDILSLCWDLN